MTTRKFPKQYLRDILWDDTPGKVEDKITGTGRWSVYHSMVFKAEDGLHYETEYSEGATEQQDETPFEYDDDEIECVQVEQAEKTVLVWQAV